MPDVDKHAFGAAVVRHRRAAGMTGRQLAAALSDLLGFAVLPQSVTGWEKGHNLPARTKVEALEKALGIHDQELLTLAGYVLANGDDNLRQLEERLARIEERTELLEELIRRLADLPNHQVPGGRRR